MRTTDPTRPFFGSVRKKSDEEEGENQHKIIQNTTAGNYLHKHRSMEVNPFRQIIHIEDLENPLTSSPRRKMSKPSDAKPRLLHQ